MKLSDFDYNLPEELIAQHPLDKRDDARLMIIDRENQLIQHDYFYHLEQYLPRESCLVLNESKVIPARLFGQKETGAQIEVFLLKQIDQSVFEVMLRPLKRLKEGDKIIFYQGLEAELINRDKRIVKFNRDDVYEIAEKIGHMPLPPYIKRSDEQDDKHDYQTVYAKQAGSVAAPTAGLHFTDELLGKIQNENHTIEKVTLHVGYGTFKPVEVEDVTEHPMHFEEYQVEKHVWQNIQNAKSQNQKVVAVGTTSCRTLESIGQGKDLRDSTNLFIYPGYEFQVIDGLITNFHLPKSTLLMLVSALAGVDLMKRAYAEAIRKQYRFYSYGDGMLIL